VHNELFKEKFSALLSGKRSVTWEGTTFRESEGKDHTYFRLQYKEKDEATREGEVQEFLRFMKSVEAKPLEAPRLKSDIIDVRSFFAGEYGTTRRNADIYFSEKGVKNIALASDSAIFAAYAGMIGDFEGGGKGPAWGDPTKFREATDLMRDYRRSPNPLERNQLESRYKHRFGRDIEEDNDRYQEAKELRRLIASLRGKPEALWASVFADIGEDKGFDFWRTIAALNKLAGKDETLIHELSIHGDRVHVAVEDEGLGRDIMTEIGKALSPP
jgi:hypothetical protein